MNKLKLFIPFCILILGIIIGRNYFQPFYKLTFKNNSLYNSVIELVTEDNIKHIMTIKEKSTQDIKIYNNGETGFSFTVNINNKIISYPDSYIDGNQNQTINIFNEKVEVTND